MTISNDKESLRKIFKKKRRSLSKAEVESRSREINQNFISNLLPRIYNNKKNSSKTFSLYLSSYNEVSTNIISRHFEENNIKFSYPKIVKKDHHLDFVISEPNQTFSPSLFFPKILEPKPKNSENNSKTLPDILIIPLLAFDSKLSRLGMGGGFFDRTIEFLKKENPNLLTIGLAYDYQRFGDILETEDNDQRLDFIVTEKVIFAAS